MQLTCSLVLKYLLIGLPCIVMDLKFSNGSLSGPLLCLYVLNMYGAIIVEKCAIYILSLVVCAIL